MNNYTPTTDDIKSIWRSRYDSEHHWAVGKELRGYEAEFDRWLKQVKAEAWEEGHHAGQHNEHEYRPRRVMANPYRKEPEA